VYQEIFLKSDIEIALRSVIVRLADVSKNTGDTTLVEIKGKPVIHTRLQTLFNLKFETSIENSIYELIVTHAIAAEHLGPGGFDLTLGRLLEALSSDLNQSINQKQKTLSRAILSEGTNYPLVSDIEWLIKTYSTTSNMKLNSMLNSALTLAGFGGRIIIEKTSSLTPSIELVRGYTFDQVPAFNTNLRLKNPRVICVDGYVEAVSEIHHLLQAASETKEPFVLFVRGLSNDVKQTLKVNLDRGSVIMIPVIVPFDLAGINTLNDIAIVSGTDVVSSTKGELISSVKFADIKRVDEVVVYPSKVVISNTSSWLSVNSHVRTLRARRSNEKIEDVCHMLDARIRTLSPNHVIIRLPDDKDYVTSSQTIDYVLRAVKSLIDHGSVFIDGKKTLAATYVAADVHSKRCVETLSSLGAMVLST